MEKETKVFYKLQGYLKNMSRNESGVLSQKEVDLVNEIISTSEKWLKEEQ